MRVRIVEGGSEAMHVAYAQAGLQRVIIRRRSRIKIQDVEEVWICPHPTGIGQRLVDVVVGEQLASERTDVANLHRGFTPKLLLDVHVEVMNPRRAEVSLVDGERVIRGPGEHGRCAEGAIRYRDLSGGARPGGVAATEKRAETEADRPWPDIVECRPGIECRER